MKISKKAVSLLLAATMILSCVAIAIPFFKLNASAATTIDGVSQTRIVGTDGSYARTYAGYASDYLNGASEPTNIVVPGLDPAQDYVIQGMTYYPQKDWMLVTAYHNDGTASSKVFCLDNTTGDFVAMISFQNTDGSTNMDHGGGIAISEHNIYYSCGDKDRKIAYAPLSAIEDIAKGEHRVVKLAGETTFYETGSVYDGDKTAYTAYVCYDEGVLWMGNFFDPGLASVIAADYKIPANSDYDNMVWGYKLSGSSSAEEWANLISGTSDCQGSPSYAIALADQGDLDIKNVQYATVDNGKLYLSRSYGSGAGNSVNFGFGETSHLTIADIDLSTPGETIITFITDAAGTTKTINTAYKIDSYHDYPMMPMSEGLCVVEDYVYLTFESASNKYLNESDGAFSIGNCEKPVDVVWKIDQYELMGVARPDEEELLYYEQVTDLSQIVDGEDYLIVHPSAEKDPVTQKPYLYALDSHGGLKDYYLAKHDSGDSSGYDAMVTHEIHNYSIEDGKLYLYNPDEDDVPNLRWQISGATTNDLKVQNTDTYFSDYRYLYFDDAKISMANSTVSTSAMKFAPVGNGNFYFYNGGNYLWCNDFTVSDYETKADNWYAANSGTAMYSGVKETKGTIHTDAKYSDSNNIIGKAVADDELYLCEFQIFKRVVDPFLSTKESRVHTDMEAELQADGTYTITLDTYATGEIQYQVLEKERPTDFIFVLDGSSSMVTNSDCAGYRRYGASNTLSAYSIAGNSTTPGDTDATTNGTGKIYVKIGGEFVKLFVDSSKRGNDGSWYRPKYYKRYWIHGNYQGTEYWWVPTSTTDPSQGGYWSPEKPAESATMYVQANSDSDRAKATIFIGEHFEYFSTGGTRVDCMQTAVQLLANEIGSQVAANSELNHRIAVLQFGCDSTDTNAWRNTGMWTNDSAFNQYTGSGTIADSTYAKAFFEYNGGAGFQAAADAVWTMNNDDDTNADTFSNYGFDMVNGIINNSGKDYYATGDRNLAIIMITDGIPGKGGSDSASANATAESAVQLAYQAKCKGASIYTLQLGNNSCEGFSMNLYMDAVSSEYPSAKSLTDLGEKNPTDVDYHIDITTGSVDMFNIVADSLTTAINANSKMGYTALDADSILREQLSEAFVVPMNAEGTGVAEGVTLSFSFTPGWYDAIGRICWGIPESAIGVEGEYDMNRTLMVTGYDYSTEYISTSKTAANPGHKLTVTITGVLANEEHDLTNTSINNDANTAIYQDEAWLANNYAFKHYPRKYFTIPEYDYMLDFGFMMYDDDVNGTLKAANNSLSRLDTSNYPRSAANGMVKIADNDLDLIYSLNPDTPENYAYVLIQRTEEDNSYDWFRINVSPASNVYYEQNDFTPVTTDNTVTWSDEGSQSFSTQDLSVPETDTYGFDSHYADDTSSFSNGTYRKVTINKNAKKSDAQTFEFYGRGFDLVSACGSRTGTLAVKVTNTKTNKVEKAYLVDTYYRDTAILDPSNTLEPENELLYQVPVVNFTSEQPANYKVEVTALYLSSSGALKPYAVSDTETISAGEIEAFAAVAEDNSSIYDELAELGMDDLANAELELVWFDENSVLNGGTGAFGAESEVEMAAEHTDRDVACYLDGFRIYHPLDQGNTSYIASEQDATYLNVINNIGSGITPDENTAFNSNIAYLETSLEDGVTLSFGNYEEKGPQNELYLKTGSSDAIAFTVNRQSPDGEVHLGLRAVTGTTRVKIGSGNKALEFDVNSATEMYYDISEILDKESQTAAITIQNTGSGLLAVNNIKLTGNATAIGVSEDDINMFSLAINAPAEEAYVVNGTVTTEKAEEPAPEPEVPAEKSFIEKAVEFIKNVFDKVFGFISNAFVFLSKGGLF